MIFKSFFARGSTLLISIAIILSLLWVGFDAGDNLYVDGDYYVYSWNDGQYEVELREDGRVFRPFMAVQRYVNTFGDYTSSLIGSFIIAFDDAIAGFYSDAMTPPDTTDMWFNEIVVAYLDWAGYVLLTIFDLLITIVSMPVLLVEWLVSSLFGVLGFLVTGQNFEYTSQVFDWLTGIVS